MIICDFCGKSQKEVRAMIKGNDGAAICGSCSLLCVDVVMQTTREDYYSEIELEKDIETKTED